MKTSVRYLLVAALAALATAIPASAASAAEANWTPQGSTQWSAPSGFTIYKNGGSAATCTITSTNLPSWKGATLSSGAELGGLGSSWARCNGSQESNFSIKIFATGMVEGGSYSVELMAAEHKQVSPWGYYTECMNEGGICGEEVTGTFVNGSGGTPSKVTFTNAHIGYLQGDPSTKITLSGTFQVTTGSGGLMTLK